MLGKKLFKIFISIYFVILVSTGVVRADTTMAPGDVSNVTADTDAQVRLRWKAPAADWLTGGDVTGGAWHIRYSSSPSATPDTAEGVLDINDSWVFIDTATYTHERILGDIKPNTTYYFWIKAEDGFSIWSQNWSTVASDISGTYTDIESGIIDLYNSSQSWGDYDNDGDLDLAIAGYTGQESRVTRIYRNDGSDTFTNINAGLTGVGNVYESGGENVDTRASLSWGDYDNDGDLDLAIAGNTGSGKVTKVYRNDGGTTFTDVSTGLFDIERCAIAWGDYDNDGDLDLLASGYTGSTEYTFIFENTISSFTGQMSTGLEGIMDGSVAWGDYDNDGDLDVLMSGYNGTLNITKVFKNDGDKTFTEAVSVLGMKESAVSWGDYDNDGDLDFAVSGTTGTNGYTSKIYRNDGSDTFTDISANILGVYQASVAWGDYDNDGDFDLALSGWRESSPFYVAKIYKNEGSDIFTDADAGLTGIQKSYLAWGDYDGDGDLDLAASGTGSEGAITTIYKSAEAQYGSVNSAPAIPSTGFSASYSSTTNKLDFKWDKASDSETSDEGLYYEIRVSTLSISGNPNAWVVSTSKGGGVGSCSAQTLGNYSHGFYGASEQPGLKISAPVEDTTYYWQVRTVDPGLRKSAWADGPDLVLADITPSVPVLSIPLDNSATNQTTVTFDWSDSTDAYGISFYELQVSVDNTFASVNYSSSPVSSQATISSMNDNQTYYWRARAKNTSGNYSDWSSYRTLIIDTQNPSTPTPSQPAHNSITDQSNITFDWNDISDLSGIDYYEIQISTNSEFIPVKYSSTTSVSQEQFSVTNSTYYWRVRAKDNVDYYSNWTSTQVFTSDTQAPTLPTLSAPLDNLTTSQSLITFDWSDSTDNLTGLNHYDLQVALDTGFSSIYYSTSVINSNTQKSLTDNTYYWRVRAVDTATNETSWTSYRTLLVDASAPSAPTLTSPADNSDTSNVTINFDWSDVSDLSSIDYYEINISTDVGMLSIYYSSNTLTSALQKVLPENIYYWHVRAFNGVGLNSAWSTSRSFTLDVTSPSVPTPITPLNNSTTNQATQTFDWTDVTDLSVIDYYEIQLASSSSFSNIMYSANPSSSQRQFSVSDNQYYWRVRSINKAGLYSTWCSTQIVNVDTISPSIPVLQVPLNASATNQTSVPFNWADSTDNLTGINHYVIQVSLQSNFSSIYYTSTPTVSQVTQVLAEGQYYYRVKSVDNAFVESSYSGSQTFIVDPTPPSVPTGFVPVNNSTESTTSITFNWDDVSELSGIEIYEIQISTLPNFASMYALASPTSSQRTETLAEGIYYWRVRAKNNAGDYSNWSSVLNLNVVIPAIAPAGFLGTALSSTTIKWTWTDNSPNEDGYRLKDQTNATIITLPANTTYYIEAGLGLNTQYTRYVESFNATGEPDSNTDSKYTLANAPSGLTVTGKTTTSISLSWTANGGSSFRLDTYQGATWLSSKSPDKFTGTTRIISGLTSNTTYTFKLQGYNGDYVLAVGSTTVIQKTNAFDPPNMPTNFIGTAKSISSIAWQWTDNATNEIGYRVRDELDTIIATLSSNTSYYLETGLSANTAYTRYIQPYNVDESSRTDNLTRYTLANPPTGLSLDSKTMHTLNLTWTGNGGTSYKLNYLEGSDSTINSIIDITATSYNLSLLLPGTTYQLGVWSYNGDGIISASSTTLSAITSPLIYPLIYPNIDNNLYHSFNQAGDVLKVYVPVGAVTEKKYIIINTDPLNFPIEVNPDIVESANEKALDDEFIHKLSLTVEFDVYSLRGVRKIDSFYKSVSITFPYDDSDDDGKVDGLLPAIREEAIKIVFLNENMSTWEIITTTLNSDKTVTAVIPHFSVYSMVGQQLFKNSLANVKVYPNPYKPGTNSKYDRDGGVVFSNLTKRAKIRVFSIAGVLVFEGFDEDEDGQFEWEARNNAGKNVASGVYIYVVTDLDNKGDKAKGRLAIIK